MGGRRLLSTLSTLVGLLLCLDSNHQLQIPNNVQTVLKAAVPYLALCPFVEPSVDAGVGQVNSDCPIC